MKKCNVYDLPLAPNICNQALREIPGTPDAWTMAHVGTNPGAQSDMHYHNIMTEIYAITHGTGALVIGATITPVRSGHVILIPKAKAHKLVNTGMTGLEYTVMASPRFMRNDVMRVDESKPEYNMSLQEIERPLPKLVEFIDGARGISYSFPEPDVSFAFGWVTNDPKRSKRPHFHEKTHEFIFIVEGSGIVEINGDHFQAKRGDWFLIKPDDRHAIRNRSNGYMVALCICSPMFDISDVSYD